MEKIVEELKCLKELTVADNMQDYGEEGARLPIEYKQYCDRIDSIIDKVNIIKNNVALADVSESTYLKEFVQLAKSNYLHKDGSIKQALLMSDNLGGEYFMIEKDKLYSR